jgi:Sec-independent protein translocase protein TatA
VSNFARRGLARSGIFKRAMSNYASEQQRSLAGVARSTGEKLAARQLEEQESAQNLQDILDEIARNKTREIYDAAANLRAWSPFTGLYS